MTTQRIVIAGIGGFGREVIDIVEACNAEAPGSYEFLGSLDDSPSSKNLELLVARGVPYLGTISEWVRGADVHTTFAIGIADPDARRAVDELLTSKGLRPEILIHPTATIGSASSLAPGTILCAGARLTTGVVTGHHAHVHVNATVGHDTALEDYSSIYPLGAVSGACIIGRGATIGAHATVLQGLRVGEGSFIGAGAVTVSDVGPGRIVKGVPAR